MARRIRPFAWPRSFERSVAAFTRKAMSSGARSLGRTVGAALAAHKAPPGAGDWMPGVAMGSTGARRFRLYRPPDVNLTERLPLLVMLHGCGQDAASFAASTRMNRIALRERFLVLYPEQDRLANAQGCWNWFDTASGRAHGEAALIMKAIDQVCLLQPVDRARIAIAGLSAGASMAALLATRHPERFKALVMHSGVPPGAAHSGLSALGAMRGRRAVAPAIAATTEPASDAVAWPPLLVIHGALDAVVSARNGQAAAEAWAGAGQARAGSPRTVQRGKRYPATVTDFKRRGATMATLVEVGRLGHAWSGGAAKQPFSDARGPDASRMAWAFVARQFRA
jgi:poly(hydroxyalkanoate) depolymerase family esterase